MRIIKKNYFVILCILLNTPQKKAYLLAFTIFSVYILKMIEYASLTHTCFYLSILYKKAALAC
ncbi:MAG: hypothetical protein R2825_16915 [Saprospiraceae bacterium]